MITFKRDGQGGPNFAAIAFEHRKAALNAPAERCLGGGFFVSLTSCGPQQQKVEPVPRSPLPNDPDATIVKLSSSDWLKMGGTLAGFAITVIVAAVTAHVSYEKRFTRLETRQENLVITQAKLVETQGTISEMKSLLTIVNERQKAIEDKLSRGDKP